MAVIINSCLFLKHIGSFVNNKIDTLHWLHNLINYIILITKLLINYYKCFIYIRKQHTITDVPTYSITYTYIQLTASSLKYTQVSFQVSSQVPSFKECYADLYNANRRKTKQKVCIFGNLPNSTR